MSGNPVESKLTGLLLLGGLSTRMGRDKALLSYPTRGLEGGGLVARVVTPAKTLLERNLQIIAPFCPEGVLISVRDEQQLDRIRQLVDNTRLPSGTQYIFDKPGRDIGPAAGLLAAYHERPGATFVVLAVDFPLVTEQALENLIRGHEEQSSCASTPSPVTCFMHTSDGTPEPFMSIWTPVALEILKENVESGRKTGPCYSAKQAWKLRTEGVGMSEGHGLIRPADDRWLINTNTPEEWQAAVLDATKADIINGDPVQR
jgi:molybdenum cofactor guanylyltransferase